MKKELVDLQPKLKQAKIENTNMMKVSIKCFLPLFFSQVFITQSICFMRYLSGDRGRVCGGRGQK